jgi:N-acetylmuramic acid 6-phosphate etherase
MNPLFLEIAGLATERINPASQMIDTMSVAQILELINQEDAGIAAAVQAELPLIEQAVNMIVRSFRQGGRLIYVGAGTSGRLGIVDASECPPTFGTPPEMVQGIIAGGTPAIFKAQEGAEDSPEAGAAALEEKNLNANDIVCGIAASGRTPFVRGALQKARQTGAGSILITTNSRESLSKSGISADIIIAPQTGPEIIAGSTRMKSGTAQKMVLNMLTTASMICLGKTYGNVMVDLQLTNAKLHQRAHKILMELTGAEYQQAGMALEQAQGHVKTALLILLAGITADQARNALEKSGGFVRQALQELL